MAKGYPQKFKCDRFKRAAQQPLRFGEDGKFRILFLPDIHEEVPAKYAKADTQPSGVCNLKYKRADRQTSLACDLETIHVIEQAIEETKPDLIVFGGDNINSTWDDMAYTDIEKTIRRIVDPVRRKNIPLAVIFGNHDGESGFHREFQMCIFMEYDNCRSNLNDEDVFGCGNCCLTIKSAKNDKDAYAIWLMDSNDYYRDEQNTRPYDCVHEDQLAWYENRAAELKAQNDGKPLPAILFQHMPVIQEVEMLEEVSEAGKNIVSHEGRFFTYGEKLLSGRLREYPCTPDTIPEVARKELLSWKKCGDIKAAFFCHDHVNDFQINVEGIDLYQSIGAGYFTYGQEHGGRLIVLDENHPQQIETKTIEIPQITGFKLG